MTDSATFRVSNPKSLRTRFAVVMGVTGLLFGFLAAGGLQWRLEEEAELETAVDLQEKATLVAGQLTEVLEHRRREIRLLATFLETQPLDKPVNIRRLLDQLQVQNPSYAWIGLTGPDGVVLASTDGLLEGRNVAERPWFSGAKRGVYFGDPHAAKLLEKHLPALANGEPMRFIDIAVPLYDAQGQLKAVLGAHLHWYWIKTSLNRLRQQASLSKSLELLIADQQQQLIYGTNSTSETENTVTPVGQHDDRFLLASASLNPSGESDGFGWTVFARQNRSEVMAPVHRARWFALLLGLGLGGLFLMLSWWLAGRETHSLRKLIAATRDYDPEGAAGFKAHAHDRQDEIAELEDAFANLVHRLRGALNRNRLFFEHAPVPLAVFDREMRYLAVSEAWLNAYHLTGQNLIGCSHYDIFPEIPDEWRELHQRGLAGETLRNDGEPLVRANGEVQWIRWEIRPWYQDDQAVGGIAIFSEEISARVAMQEALETSQKRLAFALEATGDGIWDWAVDKDIVHHNRRWCEILGLDDSYLAHPVADFNAYIHEDDRAEVMAKVSACLKGLGQYHSEHRMRHANGGYLWVNDRGNVVERDAKGNALRMVGSLSDISQRIEAEQNLRKEGRRLQLSTEAAGIGVFEWNIKTGQLLWTPEMEDLYGVERRPTGEYAYTDWEKAVDPEDLPGAVEAVQQSMVSGKAVDGEWRITTPAGETRWIAGRFQTYFNDQGEPTMMLGVNQDNSRRKKMEEQARQQAASLAQFNEELTRQVAVQTYELTVAKEQAERSNKAKGEFLASMSHEIRTPLNAVLGMAQVMERMELPPKVQEMVASIRSAGRHLLVLVNDVLDLSKIEAGRFQLNQSLLVMDEVMGNLLDVFKAQAANQRIHLYCQPLPEHLPALMGDAFRIGQVLHNLVGNALKFTAEGEVRVAVEILDTTSARLRLRFSVTDTGTGIPQRKLLTLFEDYTQADASISEQYGGTGLGLSICKQLVDLMGGTIGVNSSEGEGSEFWFELTLATADADAYAKDMGSEDDTSAEDDLERLSGLRVLVVDDSTVNLDVACQLLATEGAICSVATSGEEALNYLKKYGDLCDVVLMDVQMPGMNGLEATRAIRQQLGLTELPIIALTAGVLPSQREEALAAGMSGFVGKPFILENIVASIRALRAPVVGPDAAAPRPKARAVNADFPFIPGIDSHLASQQAAGDLNLFYSALRNMKNEFGAVEGKLRKFIAEGDFGAAGKTLHKLRGVAGNVAATELADRAYDLEKACEAGDSRPLEAKLLALARALSTIFDHLDADFQRDTDPFDASEGVSAEEILELQRALETNNICAADLYEALFPRLAKRWGAAELEPLTSAVTRLKFREAKDLLLALGIKDVL